LKKAAVVYKPISNFKKIKALPIILVFICLMISFSIFAPRAFGRPNIYTIILQTAAPQIILALGLTLVITAGEIDLSFPAVVAFSGYIFVFFFRTFSSPWVALLMAISGGGLVGLVNGLVITKLKVPSIMATLSAQFFWYGITVLLCSGLNLNIKQIRGTLLHNLFVGRINIGSINFPVQALWAIGLTIFIWYLLNRHKFGEAIMFIGDNADVARVMGINVDNKKIQLFTMHGLIAGFAGVLLTIETTTFYSNQGTSYLLIVMAAVFMGGTSISGGEGIVFGTFFGAIIIGSLEPGIVATGIGAYWVRIVTGIVMAGSVILNILIRGHGEKIIDKFKNAFLNIGRILRSDNKN